MSDENKELEPAEEAVAEFRNEHQREAHIAALEHEREGYEFRLKAAKADKDDVASSKLESRVDQVDAELARINGNGGTAKSKSKPKPKADGGAAA